MTEKQNEINELRLILVDTEILAKSTQDDLGAQRWGNWPECIKEFNRLLGAASKQGIGVSSIEAVDTIPESELGYGIGNGANAEIAKVQELAAKSARLLARVEYAARDLPSKKTIDPMVTLERICSRFHAVVRQLRSRRENRPTLEVDDEYDVQDLLHALLKIFFDDIRPEEWTPSYAGGSARMDFLLKPEQTVIEVKKTRKGLGDKEVGEQLIIDKAKYAAHPACKKLICFVYDPEGRVANPRGIETDLASSGEGELEVVVFVRPNFA